MLMMTKDSGSNANGNVDTKSSLPCQNLTKPVCLIDFTSANQGKPLLIIDLAQLRTMYTRHVVIILISTIL